MKYLIIDTSTFKANIGIGDEKLIDAYIWDSKKNLSSTLLVEIDKLLKRNKVKLKDLSGIAAYLGPGSYTGLRIGITTANALAYSLNIPIVGVRGEVSGKGKMEIPQMPPQDLNKLLQKLRSYLKGVNVKKGFVCSLKPYYGREPKVG